MKSFCHRFFCLVAIGATSCSTPIPPEPHGLALTAKPLWTADLRNHGYVSDAYKTHGRPRAIRQITFGQRDELVVINDGGICGKANPVHAFVLNSKSGAVLNKVKWNSNCWPYIFGTAQGNYAVVTSDGMSVYSSGLSKVLASTPGEAAELASPDGRVIAAWKQIPNHGLTYFLNADTLQPTGREFLDGNVTSVSPEAILHLATRAGSPNQIVLLDDGKSTSASIDTGCGLAGARFLSSAELLILGCDRLRVVNTQGTELFADAKVGNMAGSEFGAVSRNGTRFAFIREYDDSGDPSHLRIERITVFDVEARKAIFALDVRDLQGSYAHAHASGVALSPDGSLLAIDSEGIVRVFQIPGSPTM